MNQHRVADSIVDAVGETPLIRLHRVVPDHGVELFGKVEARNPAGSVKDRVGLSMIRAAEIAGVLRKGMTIVEATSGNTGIALAMAAAALGYTLVLTMPEHMSVERRAVIASYGAKIILTESVLDMQGAIDRAEQLRAADPDGVFIPGQFENPANPQVHRDTTAVEILDGLDGEKAQAAHESPAPRESLRCVRVVERARPARRQVVDDSGARRRDVRAAVRAAQRALGV